MLVEWNLNVNLISRKDIDSIYANHILPSLSIHAVRPFKKGETVIDVGTGINLCKTSKKFNLYHLVYVYFFISLDICVFIQGGGLPGLPLSIVNPDTQFTLIDSNTKKMKVVQNIVDTLKLSNVKVVCGRAENHKEKYDFVLGRAVSALPNFLSWSCHLLSPPTSSVSSVVPFVSSPFIDHSIDTFSSNTSLSSSLSSSMSMLSSGLLYLKGGDFTDELKEAEINTETIQLFPVTELIPDLPSDKFVLYIPAHEIHNFHMRKTLELRNLHTEKLKSLTAVVSQPPQMSQPKQQSKSWKRKS